MFVLLLHFYIEKSLSTTVFLEGIGSNRNVTDIGKTSAKHKDVAASLLAAHALSKFDRVSKLYGLKKKSVCSLLQKYTLQHLAEASASIPDVIQKGKIFMAQRHQQHHYGITSITDMSEIKCPF